MKTTKAYLAGLGTAGILIGSTLLALALGTNFVAFENLPEFDGARYPLERVVVEDPLSPRERAPRTPGGR